MADLMVVDGDYEQVVETLGEVDVLLGRMQLNGLANRLAGSLPTSVGSAGFAGATGRLLTDRDGLAAACGQTRGGVQGTVSSFKQVEAELEQLTQGGMDALSGVGVG